MRAILKFQIESSLDVQEINIPRGSTYLQIQYERGQVLLYVEVETDNTAGPKKIYMFYTNKPSHITNKMHYIGSLRTDIHITCHFYGEK
jgi:hypothetical protein